MDLIFGNLSTLKRWVLPDLWQTDTTKDAVIAQLGLGIAASFEKFCNRRFARVVNDTALWPANEAIFFVPRYPIEAKPTLEVRWEGRDTYEDATGFEWAWREDIGMISTTGPVGTARSLLRATFTGGFWVDATEDNSGTMPDGAIPLPADIVQAWLSQCRHVWTEHKLFANTGADEQQRPRATGIELLPLVERMLAPYQRITI